MGLLNLLNKIIPGKKSVNETQENSTAFRNRKKPLYENVVLSGVKHTIEDDIWEISYEIDDTFKQTKSHAAEVEALAVYAYGRDEWTEADEPSVSILTDDLILEAIEEYQETGTFKNALKFEPVEGMFLFKAVTEYFDQLLYFYAFETERDEDIWQLALCMFYSKEYADTENERILMRVLDEAADSFRKVGEK